MSKAYDAAAIEKYYKELLSAQQAALQREYESALAALDAQKPEINSRYDSERAALEAASMVNAVRDNEALAAAGLAGSALSAAPTTGYSETSRIAGNNALLTAIAGVNGARASELGKVNTALGQLAGDYAGDLASLAADLKGKQLTALGQYYQQQWDNDYKTRQQQWEEQFKARQQDWEERFKAQQQAWTNAWKEITTFKRVKTKETAALLGVPVGTRI